jgi:hypothetical protein
LGEFSPIVRLLTLVGFLKTTEEAYVLGLLFVEMKFMQKSLRKMGSATYWAIF